MRPLRRITYRALAATTALFIVSVAPSQAQVDIAVFDAMLPRSIGPTGMSGRIGAIDAVEADLNIIYAGAATGGLWKSVDGGVTWRPLTDSLPAASIGAVTIYQANPDVVWLGTGERNRRNSAGVGVGLYKSIDAGKSWNHMGLENTGAIDAILIHPRDPNVVYVGALGNTWTDSEDRGVYKSTDGGKTWRKVLYVNERTGAGDLVMDPSNPDHLIAAMWEHRRWPWYFKSGGPGSGLHVTYDGGENWKLLGADDGLPKGELGRTGLAFARGKPDVVYGLVEAHKSVLMRSEDGGDNWTIVNRSQNISGRPFYYGQVRVDPTNENRVWIVESPINISIDGGKNFDTLLGFAEVHIDHHAFWVSRDGQTIYDGNDGGVYISRNGGGTWRFVENLPIAQFYHISADMETPYNVYGGLQDNGSFTTAGVAWHNGGIRYHEWTEVGFGDGMATFIDPKDSRYGYTSTQNGNITRFDRLTGERRRIRPAGPDGVKLRFNWNAGMAIDPFDRALYLGSQFVHRSTDNGNSWTIISPDLTTDDPAKQMSDTSGGLTYDVSGAETHTGILAIAPSPVQQGVIWVGTDDGNVQVTRDGGATWSNVVGNIKGVPEATWVPELRASRFDAATAFVVFDNHRRGDNAPYLFKTTNYGRSWTSLVTSDLEYFLHTIEQDPVNPNVLYLGSEFGMYLSLDGGERWQLWLHGLPRAPVRGLVVHPREHDLVIGTHGRSAYILDDVRPIRELADDPAIVDQSLYLFEIPHTVQYREAQAPGLRFTGYAHFLGENRPYGALLTYWVKNGGDSTEADIEVLDADGETIRSFTGPATSGMNRTAWNLRLDPARRPSGDEEGGGGRGRGGRFGPGAPDALPGRYTIRVIVEGDTVSGSVSVEADPRFDYSTAARREKLAAQRRAIGLQEVAFEALDRLRRAESGISTVLERIEDDSSLAALHAVGDSLTEQLKEVRQEFTGVPPRQGFRRNANTVNSALNQAYSQLSSSWGAPTETELTFLRRAESRLEAVLGPVNDVLLLVEDYRQRVESAGVEMFDRVDSITMDWRPAIDDSR